MLYINGRFLTQEVTGVQRFALEISKELILLRSDIIFLVPNVNDIKAREELSGLNIMQLSGFNGHLWEQITLPMFLVKKDSPLLLNLCNTAPAFYKNQVVTHHDITYIKYPRSFSLKFRVFYKLLASFIIKNSKSVITVSEFSKSEITTYFKCFPSKIKVVSNAVSSSFKPDLESATKGNYILAVSSPVFHKNFHGLIKAFNECGVDTQLKIIGKASGNFSKSNAVDTDNRIKFLGRVSDEELINLYQHAAAFVFPSFYEGFGIPPLEAQACGCPVLSSNRASMREVLAGSALYFDPSSSEELSKAINEILYNDGLRDELISKGYGNIKRFSWHDSAQCVNEIISEVM